MEGGWTVILSFQAGNAGKTSKKVKADQGTSSDSTSDSVEEKLPTKKNVLSPKVIPVVKKDSSDSSDSDDEKTKKKEFPVMNEVLHVWQALLKGGRVKETEKWYTSGFPEWPPPPELLPRGQ